MPRILVIQQEIISLNLIANTLRLDGHQIDELQDSRQAIPVLKQQTFDLVLTDLEMRHVNGVLLLKRMNRERIAVPVVFISDSPIIAKLVKAGSGNDAIIVRPFSAALLRSTVSRALIAAPLQSRPTPALRKTTRPISAISHLIVNPGGRRRH